MSSRPARCFVTQIDRDFAVVPLGGSREAVYGSLARADVRKPFFSISGPSVIRKQPSGAGMPSQVILIQRVEIGGGLPDLLERGIWELDVARKVGSSSDVAKRMNATSTSVK